MREIRKPIFFGDLDCIGKRVWVEIEGCKHVEVATVGNLAFVIAKILGWNVETLGDIFKMQREVNYAPRIRFWTGEEEPCEEERKSSLWRNDSRCWSPIIRKRTLDQWDAYLETGYLLYEEKNND